MFYHSPNLLTNFLMHYYPPPPGGGGSGGSGIFPSSPQQFVDKGSGQISSAACKTDKP
jgi:hypothetical protein